MRHPPARPRAGEHADNASRVNRAQDPRGGERRRPHPEPKRYWRPAASSSSRISLANSGGVAVSYFERVQGLQEYFWKEDQVNAKLNDIVVRAFEETWSARERFGTSMRMAAYGLAVQRVAEVTTRSHGRGLKIIR